MRHLIVLQGKDPDFIASEPVVESRPGVDYLPFDPARAEQTIAKFNNSQRPAWTGYESWVTNLSQHPVLKARSQFEAQRPAKPENYTEPQPPELTGDELLELLNSSGKSSVSEEWAEVVKFTLESEGTKGPFYSLADQKKFAEMVKAKEQQTSAIQEEKK
jgi:hypothetical protein